LGFDGTDPVRLRAAAFQALDDFLRKNLQ